MRDKPMLWHIMKIYAAQGYNDFIIALGYKGDYIKEYFLNQKYFTHDFTLATKSGKTHIHRVSGTLPHVDDFTMTFVDTGEETLPGERILRVQDYIPKTDTHFMVTYGDGVADIDIRKLIAFHKKQKTIGTITGVHPRSKFGQARIDNSGHVTNFLEKPSLTEWVNGGFMIFSKQFFTYLRPAEYEHVALQRLVSVHQLSLFAHNGFWHSMDTYADVEELNTYWKTGPKWKIWRD